MGLGWIFTTSKGGKKAVILRQQNGIACFLVWGPTLKNKPFYSANFRPLI